MTVLVNVDGYTDAHEFCDEECVAAANQKSAALLLEESYGLETFDASQSKTVRLNLSTAVCDIIWTTFEIQRLVPGWDDFTHKEVLIDANVPCNYDGMAWITELPEWLFSITKLYMHDQPDFDGARWEWIRTHEFGHNYALVHGWKDNVEYKDNTCIMGMGNIYSGAVRYLRNWITNDMREGALVTLGAGESAVVQLQSLGTADPYAPGQVGALAVVTPYDSHWTMVVWLSPSGFVIVHRVVDLYYDHHLLAEKTEGESFTHGDTTMSVGNIYVDESNTVVSATVTFS